ncbi:response regulator [Thermodesulfobacteriota bacterium]
MEKSKYPILIVDDEESITELLSDYLEQEGFSVQSTNNPLEALTIVENENIKIILTDIKMPELSGIELLEKVKKINGLIQVIIMTGYGTLENTVQCLEQGANDYLLKPFKNLLEIKNIIGLTMDKLTRWEAVIKDIYVK